MHQRARKARGFVVVAVTTIAVLVIGVTAAFACGTRGGRDDHDRYRHVRYVCAPVRGTRYRVVRWDCKPPASTTTVANAPTTATTTTVADDPGNGDDQGPDETTTSTLPPGSQPCPGFWLNGECIVFD